MTSSDDRSTEDREKELDAGRMPFMDHLRDLRLRVRNSALALVAAFCATYGFSEEIYAWLARPLVHAWEGLGLGAPRLVFTSLLEPFWVYVSTALWAALFVAAPLIFYQLWQFVAPGLYRQERRYGIAFALTSSVLFSGGAAFCYTLALPFIYDFMLNYADDNIAKITRSIGDYEVQYDVANAIALQPMLSMQEYLSFAKRMLIGFGLIFEMPLVIFFLSLANVVTHRSLLQFGRWFVVLAFVIGAILTPPDVMSQIAMAGPLIVMYYVSIVIAWFITVRRERRERDPDR